MAVTNCTCDNHPFTHSPVSGMKFHPLQKLLKLLFNNTKYKKLTSITELHHLPTHMKRDIGFQDVTLPLNKK